MPWGFVGLPTWHGFKWRRGDKFVHGVEGLQGKRSEGEPVSCVVFKIGGKSGLRETECRFESLAQMVLEGSGSRVVYTAYPMFGVLDMMYWGFLEYGPCTDTPYLLDGDRTYGKGRFQPERTGTGFGSGVGVDTTHGYIVSSLMDTAYGPQQANYVIREIHTGSCGMHDGQGKVVHKAMSAGYYWQSMYRFRVPTVIITDNGTQLINEPFKSWVEGLEIKRISTSDSTITSKWSGKKSQPKHNAGDQDKATLGGSRVGRRATECTSVIPEENKVMPKMIGIYGWKEEMDVELRLNKLLEDKEEIAMIREASKKSR
ncbi:hypothetical protein Tco_0686730 [Tanacetum coccineum]